MNVPEVKSEVIPDVDIATIQTMDNGSTVNTIAKVISIHPARPVSTGLLQEITISDASGTIQLSAWETNINKLQIDTTYDFTNLYIRTYRNVKSLSLSRLSQYQPANDLMLPDSADVDDQINTLLDVSIIGTQNCLIYYSCVNCMHKLPNTDQPLTKCKKCSVIQNFQSCKVEVAINVLLLTNNDDKEMLKLSTDIVIQLLTSIGNTDLNKAEDTILRTPRKFNIQYSKQGRYVQSIASSPI